MSNPFDCYGGPGTTEPACGACITCLHRVIEAHENTIAGLQSRLKRFEEEKAGDQIIIDSGIKIITKSMSVDLASSQPAWFSR